MVSRKPLRNLLVAGSIALGVLILFSNVPRRIRSVALDKLPNDWVYETLRSPSHSDERDLNDATLTPGWIENDQWVSADPQRPMHNLLKRMTTRTYDPELSWLVNKTMFFYGDSVLRELCSMFCHANGIDRKQIRLDETEVNDKTMANTCTEPVYNFTVITGFQYGMINYSQPRAQGVISGEWPPAPWGFEDIIPQIKRLQDQLIQTNGTHYQPDIIVFNSGAWDFKYMYRRDVLDGIRAESIDPDELEELGERLRECLRLLQDTWPNTQLLWLNMQPFDVDDSAAKWFCESRDPERQLSHPPFEQSRMCVSSHRAKGITDLIDYTKPEKDLTEAVKLPPLFTRRRVSQLGSTYRQIAIEEGVDSVDLWKIHDAVEPGRFYNQGDSVHPAATPACHTLLGMILEKMYIRQVLGL